MFQLASFRLCIRRAKLSQDKTQITSGKEGEAWQVL